MAGIKDKLYRYSPLVIKKILLNHIATKNHKKRYSKEYYKYLHEYLDLWEDDMEAIQRYKNNMLIELLKECFLYVPYYQAVFKEAGIGLSEVEANPFEALFHLPLLPKMVRKEKVEELINLNPIRPTEGIGFTSGTSGSPTLNYIDKESIARSFALWSRFHKNIGINPEDKSVRLSGRLIVNPKRKKPPFWVLNKVDNQLFMSTYHLTEENMNYYIKKLNAFSPKLIDGYPSALYILAKYINENKVDLNFQPIAIAATAETLYDYQREEIENAFRCKIYNQYASSEGSPFITECREGRLHINEDSGIFEFLDFDNHPAEPGKPAKMIVTSFRNWKTPLLRYDIEDTVLLPEKNEPCSCGCKMPYVEKILGREDDILWTEEKGYVGRMDTAYKGLEGIVVSQLIQKNKDLLVINQVNDAKYSEYMHKLFIRNLRDRLGEEIEIQFNFVDHIPLGKNGKFDAVKREFKIDI